MTARLTRLGTFGATLTAALLVGGWAATAASAHVTVSAPGVTVGASDAEITVRVPTESDTANTVGLKLQLPTDHPIAGVLVAPHAGWTAVIKQTKLATPIKTDDGDITQVVSEIDWTADAGAGIKPGYFGDFIIIGGKLPDDVDKLTFKAVQTYSDGKQVAWIQEAAAGSTAEVEDPAPVLDLTAAATPTTGATPTVTATPTSTAAGASKGAATTGIVLGAVGVLLGAGALAVAFSRRRAPTAG